MFGFLHQELDDEEVVDGDAPVPSVVDPSADARFRQATRAAGFREDDAFVENYVAWEWRHARHVFRAGLAPVDGRDVLEFGCHLGATAVVLAALGARRVVGIDVAGTLIPAARANVERYGYADRIELGHVPDTRRLPYPDASFDVISCISVLEYVPKAMLADVLRELDRVLRPGGVVAVCGSSNRLYPRELHKGTWLVNYVPEALDGLLFEQEPRRGLSPLSLRRGFPGYRDRLAAHGGERVAQLKTRMGMDVAKVQLIRLANLALSKVGLHAGYVLPQIVTVLEKPGSSTASGGGPAAG